MPTLNLNMKLLSACAFATLCVAVGTASAQASVDAKTDEISRLAINLQAKYPQNPPPKLISKTEIPGLYELLLEDQIAYVDGSGSYFIFGGNLVDLQKRANLTEARKSELLRIDLGQLNEKDAIVRVKGTGARKLYLFSDPFCPYCQRLELELDKLTDVTIVTFLVPRPDAKKTAESIWCSETPAQAWEGYMKTHTPPAEKSCPNPIAKTLELGGKLGIQSTPTMFTAEGRRHSGLMQAERIDEAIVNGIRQVQSK